MQTQYKRIDKPFQTIRTLLLLPALIVLILLFILKPIPAYPLWAILTGGLSLLSYFGVMTFACLNQKCYMQLARTYLTILLAIVTFIAIIDLLKFTLKIRTKTTIKLYNILKMVIFAL